MGRKRARVTGAPPWVAVSDLHGRAIRIPTERHAAEAESGRGLIRPLASSIDFPNHACTVRKKKTRLQRLETLAKQPAMRAPESNPFCTRFTRPGALRFAFPPECQARDLVATLIMQDWWGQILGPHGSGKSTLLETLIPELTASGRAVIRYSLRGGQRRLRDRSNSFRQWNRSTQVVVDGYEQLSSFQRWRLRSRCRRAGAGLLITAHRSMGLPDLFTTRVDLDVARTIVHRLLDGYPAVITERDIRCCHRQQQGNLRETLFVLYDLYGQRRSQESVNPGYSSVSAMTALPHDETDE